MRTAKLAARGQVMRPALWGVVQRGTEPDGRGGRRPRELVVLSCPSGCRTVHTLTGAFRISPEGEVDFACDCGLREKVKLEGWA